MKIDRFYRPELDVLRFLAFLIVFLVHRMDFLPIDPAQHFWLYNLSLLGDFGVPVFFLLSAFLITELLTREQDSIGNVHPGAFYMRRMLRIWPLYFAVFYGLVLLQRFQPGTGPQNPTSCRHVYICKVKIRRPCTSCRRNDVHLSISPYEVVPSCNPKNLVVP